MQRLSTVGKEIHESLEKSRKAKAALASLAFILVGALAAFWVPLEARGAAAPGAPLELKTTAFQPGGEIPVKHTCEGSDVSPALTWTDPPAGTKTFALIADDPDAPMGTWVHWVLYDLPGTARQLPEGLPKVEEIQGGGRHGRNDFPNIGYGGPCPPPGKAHRYFFKLYALDTKLGLSPGATKQEVEQAMKGHILARAELMGRYHR